VCRIIKPVGPPLALEPTARAEGAVEQLWIVDGTLVSASMTTCMFAENL
jgi:hypothetical protein